MNSTASENRDAPMSDQERSRHRGNQSECWLIGGGEMGDLVRAKDWSHTPLGPIESWPQSLRTTVSLCLASNFPISIAWGPQRVQIYNDGYWPICAAKHPRSMGQDFKECWLSAWPVIGDAFERASNGETCFLVNQRMFLDRLGYLEETFFTFSFSPIRDESGRHRRPVPSGDGVDPAVARGAAVAGVARSCRPERDRDIHRRGVGGDRSHVGSKRAGCAVRPVLSPGLRGQIRAASRAGGVATGIGLGAGSHPLGCVRRGVLAAGQGAGRR
ncbi:hypothetical protein COMA2_20049 [Candidatus Nitrospira nitrificans]|uniref:PAS fold-4 domain-containing protein n=1 Tax=Candidatus Nitrospira nitrificans TaxID=1742973 RepID=A0A0S4LEK6_9BACT|nr:hypothetical protein COMA2_20049 [Candidatus Nitrospira nitrificans]